MRADDDCVGADSASDRAHAVVRQTGLNLKIKLGCECKFELCRTGTQKIAVPGGGKSGRG